MDIDIDITILREKSLSQSSISSRESSVLSKASSVPYYERMEIQSNNLLWSKQVGAKETALSSTDNLEARFNQDIQEFDNGNKAGKQHVVNNAPSLNSAPSPQVEHETIDVRVEDNGLGFYLFSLIFLLFPLNFYYWKKKTKCDTVTEVTCSCDAEKGIEDSGTR